MRAAAALFLAACAGGPPSPQAPPPGPTLDVTRIARGQLAAFEVYNAPPHTAVTLMASEAGLGTTCHPVLGGACLGLASPVRVLGTLTTDDIGHGRLQRSVPHGLAGPTAAIQAVVTGPGAASLSNVIEQDVQPGPHVRRVTVYDDLLSGDWQPEIWPCGGSGQPTMNLASAARIGSGARAAAIDMGCVGGWSGVGFDRRSADGSVIHWMYPDQHLAVAFRFHHGASAADDDPLEITVDLEQRWPLRDFLHQPDAAGWYDVVIPLAIVNADAERFRRIMLFAASPTATPEFVLDRVELVQVDDFDAPRLSDLVVQDILPDGAVVTFTTDEHARIEARARGGGVTVEVAQDDLATDHTLTLTGLPSDTVVDVEVRAIDHQDAGPSFHAHRRAQFRTTTPDLTPPRVGAFRVDRIGATVATVCWTTDEPATARIDFGSPTRSVTLDGRATDACAHLTGLTPLTRYEWTVVATDRWGNATTAPSNLPFTTAVVPTASATLDRNVVTGAFPDEVRGVNLGNWTFFWGRVYPGDSPKLRELLRIIRPGFLRHAGGNWSNAAMWDPTDAQCYPRRLYQTCERSTFSPWVDGVDRCGAVDEIVPQAYQHAYQADEVASVVELARDVGAEVMIEVNATTCDPTMWASMVEHANVVEGWDVRYWEIGNEHDYMRFGEGADAPVGADYVATYKAYHDAMKAVDPSIELIGPTASQHEEDGTFQAMSQLVLPLIDDPEVQAAGMLDALSWHVYPYWNGVRDIGWEELLGWGPVGTWEGRRHLDTCVAEKRAWLDARGMTDTRIALTEVNGIVATRPTLLNVNHAGALYTADVLPRLARSGADLVGAWNLYDDPDMTGYGLIDNHESTLVLDPSNGLTTLDDAFAPNPVWYTYAMLARMFGTELLQTTSSRDDLAVWASRDPARPGDVWLWVVNLSDDAITATVRLGGWIPSGGARAWVLANERFVAATDKEAVRDGTTINGLAVDTSSAAAIAASWQAIEASGVAQPVSASGVTRMWPALTATAVLLDGP